MSYTVTLGIRSVETLKGVPICHCQWIGVDEPGRHIFPKVVVVFGTVEVWTDVAEVFEEVIVELELFAVVIGNEGVVLAGHAVESRPIADIATIKNNSVIFFNATTFSTN